MREDPALHESRRATANGERGIALLITILILLLVSAIGISALNRASDENLSAAASRRQVTNMAAAEAAMKLVERQLRTAQGGASNAKAPISIPNFIPEQSGLSTAIRTGTIGTPAPQEIDLVGTVRDEDQDMRIGRSVPRFIYRARVVATDPGGGNVQIHAQFGVRGR